jgi:hypothetical protein
MNLDFKKLEIVAAIYYLAVNEGELKLQER